MAVHPNSLANLKKGKKHQFTAETAAINGAKGGHAAAPVLAARKTLRAELEELLAKHPINEKTGEESEMSYQAAMTAAILKKALRGDSRAFEIIRDTIGEKPVENVQISTPDFSALDSICFDEK